METIKQKIDRLRTNTYSLQFEHVFTIAFENYKKIAVYAGLVILVFSFLLILLVTFGLVAFVGVENLTLNAIKQMELQLLKPEYIGYQFLAIVGISSVFCPISAGFLKMAEAAEKNIEFKIPMFLHFYKWSYYKELFLATFIIASLSTAIDSAFAFFEITILGSVLSFGVTIITVLSLPLIIFGNLKAIPALEASIRLSSQQILTIFLLMLVAVLGSLVGLIGFCIGIFFTIPFQISMQYAIYEAIIGVEKEGVAAAEIEKN